MADIITGGRPIKTGLIPTVDFCKGMRGVGSEKAEAANAHLMTDVGVTLYSGKELPDDQRASYNGKKSTISLNLGKLTNMSPKLLGMLDTTQPAPCGYTGNTPEGTPVQVDTVTRRSVQDPKQAQCVQLTMDLQAVANVNDIERDKGRAAKGLDTYITGDPKKDRKNPKLGRLDVQLQDSTTTQGVPAMNQGRLEANLGEMAAQNYLMTTGKGTAKDGQKMSDKLMVQKEDVASVAALYAKEYKAFAEKYAESDCKGIKAMEKQADGSYKQGKAVIEGTGFKSLKAMGFQPQTLEDGSMALVCVDGSKEACETRKGPEGLRAFDNAFAKHMSQVVSQTYESGTVARNLGAQFGIASYPTTIPGSDMTLIQPSSQFTVKSFANSVTTSVECATHNNVKPIEEIYGKAVLDNTRTIQGYFPDKGGSEGRDKVLEEIKSKVPGATKAYDAPELD